MATTNVIDFHQSALKVMSRKAVKFLADNRKESFSFKSTKLFGLNRGAVTAVLTKDKEGIVTHMNMKYVCVACDEPVKLQYLSLAPEGNKPHWIASVCDNCYEESEEEDND